MTTSPRYCQCGQPSCQRTITKSGQKYHADCKRFANNALNAHRKLYPVTDTRRKRAAAPATRRTWTLDGISYSSFQDFVQALRAPGRKQYR